MNYETWNFYYSGILYGIIKEKEDGLYVSCLDSMAGQYGEEIPFTEEADRFFYPFSRRKILDFFHMKGECEEAIKSCVDGFVTASGAEYKKRKNNSYIQRRKKYPFDLFHEEGELYAVYMTVRDSMAVLVKDGWEGKTVLKEWENVFGEKAFPKKMNDFPYYKVVFHGTFQVLRCILLCTRFML